MASDDNHDDQQQFHESPFEDAPPVAAAVAAQAPKKKGSMIGRLLSGVTLIALIAGAAGYGAVTFKDQDPRLKLVADYVEDGLGQARGLIDGVIGSQQAAAPGKPLTHRTAPLEEQKTTEAPPPAAELSPQIDEAAAQKAQRDAEETVKAAQAEAEAAARAATEKAAQAERAAVEQAAAERAEAEKRAAEAKAAEDRATEEKAAQERAARQSLNAAELSTQDLLAALEGRIDELGEEIKTLRARLDTPKNETRAAPETISEKPAVATSPDTSAALVVVAYALQRQLEAGRAFADELAALSRMNAPAEPMATLTPFAEKGAPTGEKLRIEFASVAKKMRSAESEPATTGDITDQLMRGASKLVKVRPSGQAHVPETDNSIEGKAARIDAALTHNDFGAASEIFRSLPDNLKTEAKGFEDALQGRIEADRAATTLIHEAIAALGARK